ncbi:MAG: SDR family oxidoreductase [Endomicrobium sp.]|jgi:NADP-dependent 3-hydroxy acid dehydrogenase YdfG|nr:SDR family oxidoreductase [Endomicrobium sp.]
MIKFSPEQRFIATGASSGIGEGAALSLNELGASVVGIGRNRDRVEALKAKAKFAENMFIEEKNLTENINDLPKYIKTLKDKYGKFQRMAYCAGITQNVPLQLLQEKEFKHVFDINYFTPIYMAKRVADRRINNGYGSSGGCL